MELTDHFKCSAELVFIITNFQIEVSDVYVIKWMTAIPVIVVLRVRVFWGLHQQVMLSPVIRMGIN